MFPDRKKKNVILDIPLMWNYIYELQHFVDSAIPAVIFVHTL